MSESSIVAICLAAVAIAEALIGFIVYQVFLRRIDDLESRMRALETSNTKLVTLVGRWKDGQI